MEEAAKLLQVNPHEKVRELEQKTGFVSPKHFHSVFKKFYGTTPAEFLTRQ